MSFLNIVILNIYRGTYASADDDFSERGNITQILMLLISKPN